MKFQEVIELNNLPAEGLKCSGLNNAVLTTQSQLGKDGQYDGRTDGCTCLQHLLNGTT